MMANKRANKEGNIRQRADDPKLARSVVKDTDIPWMLGVFVMGDTEAKARYLSGSTLDKKDLEEIRKLDQ